MSPFLKGIIGLNDMLAEVGYDGARPTVCLAFPTKHGAYSFLSSIIHTLKPSDADYLGAVSMELDTIIEVCGIQLLITTHEKKPKVYKYKHKRGDDPVYGGPPPPYPYPPIPGPAKDAVSSNVEAEEQTLKIEDLIDVAKKHGLVNVKETKKK